MIRYNDIDIKNLEKKVKSKKITENKSQKKIKYEV